MALPNPFEILLLFRNGTANSWQSLCEACGEDLNSTPASWLSHSVESLIAAQLLAPKFKSWKGGGAIELGPQWEPVQRALEISLTTLARVTSATLAVNPVFGLP